MVLQEREPKPVLYLTLCINALVFLFLSLLEQPFHTPMPSYRWASGRCLPLSCLLMWCFSKTPWTHDTGSHARCEIRYMCFLLLEWRPCHFPSPIGLPFQPLCSTVVSELISLSLAAEVKRKGVDNRCCFCSDRKNNPVADQPNSPITKRKSFG